MDDQSERLEAAIPALRRYAYALTRDRDAADDLVQDCLERALARWALRRPDGELRPWLFAILRNLHITAYRTRRRRGPHLGMEAAASIGTPAGQDIGLEAQDMLAALSRLTEDQRSILLLIGVEDLSYEEAAAVLGVPTGTVMSRLSRARKRLRELLAPGPMPFLRRVK